MSVGTLGLYTLYWDYQNWRLLEQRTHNGGRQVLLLRLISCVSVRLRVRFLFFGFVNLYKRFALCHTARFPSLIVRGSSRLVLCVCIFFSIFFFLFFFIHSFFLLVICFLCCSSSKDNERSLQPLLRTAMSPIASYPLFQQISRTAHSLGIRPALPVSPLVLSLITTV